jgi:L-ribulose-5-phosphate 3-epimerase UlaE
VKECIANLEHNGNAKLCIHQRDFLPGEEITVNITNAIHESKKTICIITREFLKSYYDIGNIDSWSYNTYILISTDIYILTQQSERYSWLLWQ